MDMAKWLVVFSLAAQVWGCGDDGSGDGPDGSTEMCTSDDSCDDGAFCNGVERCMPESGAADASGCIPGERPCDGVCDEEAASCGDACERPDADGDGADSVMCGGTDCDDADPNRFPSNPEICDPAGLDDDCDGRTLGPDADGDGFQGVTCCNLQDDGSLECGGDCDDSRATVNPTAVESCNGIDDDCDGLIDEEVRATFYRDFDGDGFGVTSMTEEACSRPDGFAIEGGDCDDMTPGVNPGVAQRCVGVDDDCDGGIDEGCSCMDGSERDCGTPDASDPTGFRTTGECTVGTQTCAGGTLSACDAVLPSAEVCDGEDDDCDGTTDEGVRVSCRVDTDGDGFGVGSAQSVCPAAGGGCPDGFTANMAQADCDDSRDTVFPGASEVCNGRDDDCDTDTDETFQCERNAIVSGTNMCGRTGQRACDSSCMWIDDDFYREETTATCDYCSDSAAGFSAEEPFTLGSPVNTLLFSSAATRALLGDAMCNVNMFGACLDVQLHLGSTENAGGGVYYTAPLVIGHGVVRVSITVDARSGTAGVPHHGFAIVALREGSGTQLFGAGGANLHVPTNRTGFSAEWFLSHPTQPAGNDVDAIKIRRLNGSGSGTYLGQGFPTNRLDLGMQVRTLEMVLQITPDDPTTGPDELEIRVFDGAMSRVACIGAAACGATIIPGDRFVFGVTSAGGSGTNRSSVEVEDGAINRAQVCP